MAVLTVPSLRGDALESFSMRVAEAWKIGRKGQDTGALLVVVRDSHAIRLEIGYGWEGSINDARAGDIIRGMGSFFRSGRFADGCLFAVQQVQGFVTGNPTADVAPAEVAPPAPRQTKDSVTITIGVIFWFIIYLLIFSILRRVFGSARTTIGRAGSSGGGWSGGGSSGGGFSGGGGSFGGGGASGSW